MILTLPWPEPPGPTHLSSQRLSPLHPTSLLQGPGSLPCAPLHTLSPPLAPPPAPELSSRHLSSPPHTTSSEGGLEKTGSSLEFLSTLMGPPLRINSRRTEAITISLKAGFPASGPADTPGWTTLLWACPVYHGVVSSVSGLDTPPRACGTPSPAKLRPSEVAPSKAKCPPPSPGNKGTLG